MKEIVHSYINHDAASFVSVSKPPSLPWPITTVVDLQLNSA